ncbi:MAG: hypothetical protein V7640_3394, partial [Betaproteobacteria bacterium]
MKLGQFIQSARGSPMASDCYKMFSADDDFARHVV